MSEQNTQNKICCICGAAVEKQEPDVLTFGSWGVPRLLCESCSAQLETLTTSTDADAVRGAMETLHDHLVRTDCEDPVVQNCTNELFASAAARIDAIQNGTYTPADAEDDDPSMQDLSETEEDRELDRQDEEREQRIGKVVGVIQAILIALVVAFVIKRFFF